MLENLYVLGKIFLIGWHKFTFGYVWFYLKDICMLAFLPIRKIVRRASISLMLPVASSPTQPAVAVAAVFRSYLRVDLWLGLLITEAAALLGNIMTQQHLPRDGKFTQSRSSKRMAAAAVLHFCASPEIERNTTATATEGCIGEDALMRGFGLIWFHVGLGLCRRGCRWKSYSCCDLPSLNLHGPRRHLWTYSIACVGLPSCPASKYCYISIRMN